MEHWKREYLRLSANEITDALIAYARAKGMSIPDTAHIEERRDNTVLLTWAIEGEKRG